MYPRHHRNRLICLAFFSALLAGAALPLHAASEASKDETVELPAFEVNTDSDHGYVATQSAGATRTNTPLIEVAHTINVINKELIQDTGADSLYDVARYISGITGGDQRNDGDFGSLGFAARGFAINRQRNGLNATSAAALVDLTGYERVEIIKGASAVQTGSSNPGGILNYVAKQPFFRNETVLSATADTYGLVRGTVDANYLLFSSDGNKGALRVVVSDEDRESFMDYQYRHEKFAQIGAKFQFGSDTSLTFRFETQQERGRESVGIPYVFYSSTSPTFQLLNLPIGFYRGEPAVDHKNAVTSTFDIQAEHHFGPNWTANFSGYFARAWTDRAETFFFPPSGNDPTEWTRGLQLIPSLVKAGAAEFNLLGNINLGPTKHQLLVGLSMLDNDSYSFNERWNYNGFFDPEAPVYGVQTIGAKTLNQSSTATNTFVGGYVQDTAHLFDGRLILGGGFRWDYNPSTGTNLIANTVSTVVNKKVSPRYSALYRVTNELSVYVAYNQSFQPAPTGYSFDGKRFEAVAAEQYEAGIKHNFFDGKISGNVAVYQLKQTNAIVPDPVNPGFNLQGGVTSSNGYETDLAFQLAPGWQLIGGYSSYIFRRNAEIEQGTLLPGRLPVAPQMRGTLWTKYDFQKGVLKNAGFGLGMVHEGERFGNPDRQFRVPGYTVINGLLTYRLGRYKVGVNIENLFNSRYVLRIEEARTYNPGPPLTFQFTLKATY